MTHTDIKKTLNGFKRRSDVPRIVVTHFTYDPKADIPDEFDWRKRGAVTPVKNQGHCGSCWAFSATGALEGQYFLKTGKLESLSEQNLMDCSYTFENDACNGGDMDSAFEYVHCNDGIDSEGSYPYQEKNENKCQYQTANNITSTKGYATIESGNENDLKAAIATIGPIAVAMDASSDDFTLYGSGIFYTSECLTAADDLDHGVLAIGYGTDENGDDYWLVKNSWGTSWGEDGYVRMARNRDNSCGIASSASFPLNY